MSISADFSYDKSACINITSERKTPVILFLIAGGLDDVNCYRTVERYDPQSDEWTEVASLKSPRGGVGVATLGKHLYAAGGNDGSASLQTVERWVQFLIIPTHLY